MKLLTLIEKTRSAIGWLLLPVMLGACSGAEDKPQSDRWYEQRASSKAPTLASLEPAAIPAASAKLPEVSIDTLVGTYRQVLEVSEDAELKLQVMRRLAGLEMRRGEQQLFEGPGTGGEFALAIEAYQTLLRNNPDHPKNDQLLYQLSKAYDLGTDSEQSMAVLNQLVAKHPDSVHYAEAQFRRGETFFAARDYRSAEQAYAEVIAQGDETAYYQNALYMYGWSQFKRERYRASLRPFTEVLDLNVPLDNDLEKLKRGKRQLTEDVFKVMSLAFSYLDGAATIDEVYNSLGQRHYLALLYDNLGKLYLQQERYRDSAEVYRFYIAKYPQADNAPVFYARLIDSYIAAGFAEDVLREKENYVRYYGIHSDYWQLKSEASRDYIRPFLKKYIPELARHYHAKAQQTTANLGKPAFVKKLKRGQRAELAQQSKNQYVTAGDYYQQFIETFPDDAEVPEIQFLLAESRFEAELYEQAIAAYEVVAYKYPDHKRGAEGGYAAILAYNELLERLPEADADNVSAGELSEQEKWLRLKIASQLRFANTYQNDARAPAVLAKSAEELLTLKEYTQAIAAAEQLLRRQPPAERDLRKTAALVVGHSQFELLNYAAAEQAYQQTLPLLAANDPTRADIVDRIAASVYKQAEAALAEGNQQQAIDQYLRVGQVAPGSDIAATAQYDAANVLMDAKNYSQAIAVLDSFRQRYPNNPLAATIPAKMVVALQSEERWVEAANELTGIYRSSSDVAARREALYQAAELYEKAGEMDAAIDRYSSYADNFAEPFPAAMEARYKVSELHQQAGREQQRRRWLTKMIDADRRAGSSRTDRSRYLAALSSTVFADDAYQAYRVIPLNLPLKNSLKKKKQALDRALSAYTQVIEYGGEELATQSTYRIGSIYSQLSKDLMASQRPNNLDELALEQYELLLEEQAFPFEEKAIEIHESNARRSWDGLYDDWVKDSFTALQTLLPARYGKQEAGGDFANDIY